MISSNAVSKNGAHSRFPSCMLLGLLLCAANLAPSANAQSNTTLFAGAQNVFQTGPASVTLPGPAIILPGTALNPTTGLPVRHLWYGDNVNGLCRVDPDVDSAGTAPGPGLGTHSPNLVTCLNSITTPLPSAGQMAFDPATNKLYVTDTSRFNFGLFRMQYLPSGDNGQGSIDLASVQVLVGPSTNPPACPPPPDPTLGGNSVGTQADAVVLSPDGSLYFGYLHGGQVVKVTNPSTLNPAVNGACQANVSVPIIGPDEANKTAGNNFGMTWVGHTLFSGDKISPWEQLNADACVAGNNRCAPGSTNAPLHILANEVAGVQGGVTGDGNNIYFATFGSVTQVSNVASGANFGVTTNYGGPFCFISGIGADAADPQHALYVGVDCNQGGIVGGGAIYKVVLATGPITDLTLTMTGPASVNQNTSFTDTMVVTNTGNQDIFQAALTDNVPGNVTGATFTTTKGACAFDGPSLLCNLGELAPGAAATVTFTMTAGTTSVTNSATASEFDSAGNPVTDATPANNTASFTTTVINPPPVQTDIQVTGSAQNGGPNAGSADTYTWQIKDNQGSINAPNVVFTNVLPSNLQFSSVSSTLGSCTGPAPGSAGGTISCSVATLPGGQTMVVTVNVVVTQAATISTTGSATFQGTDTNPNNNSFTVTIQSK